MKVAHPFSSLFFRMLLIILLVFTGYLIFSTQISPVAKADTNCQGINVPNLALASGQPAQYTIYGVLCINPSYAYAQSITLLVSGATYSHIYWDWPNTPNYPDWSSKYSAVQYLTRSGFSTFNIDRIGIGQSSHPISSLVDVHADVYILHELVGLLRTGAIGGIPFNRVFLAGHALGSAMVLAEASIYRDVDGVIVTGCLHMISQSGFSSVVYLMSANEDPSGRFVELDSGYLTTVPGTRSGFYYAMSSDPAVIQYDEQTKETATQDEINTLPWALSDLMITVPALIIVGQNDPIFCASDAVDCSSSTSVYSEEAPYYSSALQVVVIPSTGHDLNLEITAPQTFKTMESWLATM